MPADVPGQHSVLSGQGRYLRIERMMVRARTVGQGYQRATSLSTDPIMKWTSVFFENVLGQKRADRGR